MHYKALFQGGKFSDGTRRGTRGGAGLRLQRVSRQVPLQPLQQLQPPQLQRGRLLPSLAALLLLTSCATSNSTIQYTSKYTDAGLPGQAGPAALPESSIFAGIEPGLVLGEDFPPTWPTWPTWPQPGQLDSPAISTAILGLLRLQRAYPHKFDGFVPAANDVYFRVGGSWYRWAAGRAVPAQSSKKEEEQYTVLWDFEQLGEPVWKRSGLADDPELAVLQASLEGRDARIHSPVLGQLFGQGDEAEMEATMQTVDFLGFEIQVNLLVVPPLARVDARIRAAMQVDPATRSFVDGLNEVWGFFWRDVAGTSRTSYHSWGLAVDLLPKSYHSKAAYWRWTASYLPRDWWNLRENQFWTPPQTVIDAFEAEGFVWGGRWLAYDTIHFEYHPEAYW